MVPALEARLGALCFPFVLLIAKKCLARWHLRPANRSVNIHPAMYFSPKEPLSGFRAPLPAVSRPRPWSPPWRHVG
eukprot:2525991-Heterocapsa_arctica.AAC.1